MIRSLGYRGLVLLVFFGGFVVATCRVVRQAVSNRAQVTLTFAHLQLESGIREGLDAVARDYEALHPGVRVRQMLIPERIYTSWGRTQVIGGTGPDLVEMVHGIGGPTDQPLFYPLTDEIEQPNPYNAGTPLARVAWRSTYVNGMDEPYLPFQFERYSASVFATTTRIYYNLDLMREITGRTEPPRTFEELLELGDKVRAFSARTGRDIVPLATSRETGTAILDDLFRGQTQRLAAALNPGGTFPVDTKALYLGYVCGEWTLDHPGIRGAAELMSLVCREMPPGFLQFHRDDALFYFAQGRALMLLAFSQDATGIRRQVNFPFGVFRDPSPQPGKTGFGANLLGPSADEVLNVYGGFGIVRSSPHPELALDFLRFLTSQAEDRKFARLSGTLPVIVGIEPEGFMKNFAPDSHGYPPGPTLSLGTTAQVLLSRMHLLSGPDGSSAAFLDSVRPVLADAMRADLADGVHRDWREVALNDSDIEATHRLLRGGPPAAALRRKFPAMVEAQTDPEANACYVELKLHQAAGSQ